MAKTLLTDYISLVGDISVNAYQDIRYIVRGTMSVTAFYSTTLRDLVDKAREAVEEKLSPIFQCRNVEELNKLDLEEIEDEIYNDLIKFLEERVARCDVEYDSGDVDIDDKEVDYIDDVQVDDFRSEIKEFVSTVVEKKIKELTTSSQGCGGG